MEFEVGSVLTGKVTAITKFGAFVSFASGKSGLVHISEIANAYVSNISDFLKEGQEVSVKIISIDDAGRMNLSIKQAQAPEARPSRTDAPFQRQSGQQNNFGSYQRRDSRSQQRTASERRSTTTTESPAEQPVKSADALFEDKLKRFMQDSDSKISGLYSERKSSRRRSRG